MIISSATKVLAIVGDPVAQSLSPVMQNGWIADHGIDAVYVALPLRAANAEAALGALKALRLHGLNITVPHKAAAAQAADRCEAVTANVWRWELDGSVSAFDTDGPGFLDSLDEGAPGWRRRTKRALIVGAGGAAVAIGKALSPIVDSVHFVNRTWERSEIAAASIPNGGCSRWENLSAGFEEADLIVQATTLNMSNEFIEWPIAHARAHATIIDIVYRPLTSGLIRSARTRGLTAVDGLGMLIHQGRRAFELWFGVTPDAAKARGRLMAALGESP